MSIFVLDDRDIEHELPGTGVWLTVGCFSVWVHRADEGLSISVYPKDQQGLPDSVAELWVLDSEVQGGETT
jgi:hypothetical protein